MKKCKFLILLLTVSLIAVSVSFYCNHKKWKCSKVLSTKEISNEVLYIKNFIKAKFSNESTIFNVKIDGITFKFSDLITSWVVDSVSREIGKTPYDFDNIDFKEGDIVIDIGGNIGMISIYLAKKFPFLKIYAFEPVQANYNNFIKNIKLNNIPEGTITVEHCAVTKDGRNVDLMVDVENPGGSCITEVGADRSIKNDTNVSVPSITLEDIFKKYNINHCKLLKMDCEGSEYEILYNTNPEILNRCENLRAEFHTSEAIEKQFGSVEKLLTFIKKYILNVKITKALII